MTLGQNSASRLANVSAFMADIIDVGGTLTGVPVKVSDHKCTQGMLESVVTLPTSPPCPISNQSEGGR